MNLRIYISIMVIVCASAFSCFAAQKLKAVAVSGGEEHSLVVADNNEVFSAGDVLGRSGDSDVFGRVLAGETNTSTGFLENINAVGAGYVHALALTKTGQALAWGADDKGELGNPNYYPYDSTTPVWVHAGEQKPSLPDSNLCNIICIAAGRSGEHSLAVDTNHFCYAWGRDIEGQLGINRSNDYWTSPVKVLGGQQNPSNPTGTYLSNIISVSAGQDHSMALAGDGNVYTFGNNSLGKLGINDNNMQTTPVKVHGVNNIGYLSNIKSISAGWDHCMALEKIDAADPNCKGRVYCWGHNGARPLVCVWIIEKIDNVQRANPKNYNQYPTIKSDFFLLDSICLG